MKKTILFTAMGLMAGGVAFGAAPELVPGFYARAFSPDGRYVASDYNGTVAIMDLQTNDIWMYEGGETNDYTVGHGNCWSSNGILAGSTTVNGGAAYWIDGEWKTITSAYEQAYTNAITPDGRYICGDVTNLENTLGYDGTMLVPVLWADLDGDHVYESETFLPHPEFDRFNCYPQYINALCISEDASVIAGQVVDFQGGYRYPIVWTRNAEGAYEYSFPDAELFNPDKLQIPVYPTDPGNAPDPTDYMSPDQKAAYEAAYAAYEESGYNEDLKPNPANYMTPEQIEAYNAAVAAYNALAEIWNEQLPIFSEAYYQILLSSVNFVFNNSSLSPDGKKLVQTAEISGETYWDPSTYYAVVFDLDASSYKKFPTDKSIIATQIANDGRMLGNTAMSFGGTDPIQAYIYVPGNDDFILLYDYFKTTNPEYAAWMDENMRHNIETYDENYEIVVLENVLSSGTPFASADMSKIGTAVLHLWEDPYEYSSAIFSDVQYSGISDVASKADITLKAVGSGAIAVSGDAASVEIYDLSGRCVYSTDKPASLIQTGLAKGIYVVKASDSNGKSALLKAVL